MAAPVPTHVSSVHSAVSKPHSFRSANVTPHLILRASTSSALHMLAVAFRAPILTDLMVPSAMMSAWLPLTGSYSWNLAFMNCVIIVVRSIKPSKDLNIPEHPLSVSQSKSYPISIPWLSCILYAYSKARTITIFRSLTSRTGLAYMPYEEHTFDKSALFFKWCKSRIFLNLNWLLLVIKKLSGVRSPLNSH